MIVYLDPSDTRADSLTNGNGNEQGTWALKADLPYTMANPIPPVCLGDPAGDFFREHIPHGCVVGGCVNASGAIGWPTYALDASGARVAPLDLVTVWMRVLTFDPTKASIALTTNVPGLWCNAVVTPGEALNNMTEWAPERLSCVSSFSNIWNVTGPLAANQTNEEFDASSSGAIIADLELAVPNPYVLEWTGTWTFTYPNGCVVQYAADMQPWATMTTR